jgi:hypothetical protein
MADDSETRLSHRLVVPIRDTLHAPIIFFEWAPLSGYADGIVSITLGIFCPEIQPSGEIRREPVIAAHLKCSIQAAVNLREAINNALSRASQAPEVTAQVPKDRRN